jgi:hypothetical protein
MYRLLYPREKHCHCPWIGFLTFWLKIKNEVNFLCLIAVFVRNLPHRRNVSGTFPLTLYPLCPHFHRQKYPFSQVVLPCAWFRWIERDCSSERESHKNMPHLRLSSFTEGNCKGKCIPGHAMKHMCCEFVLNPNTRRSQVIDHLLAPAFLSRRKPPGILWIREWMGPRDRLEALE